MIRYGYKITINILYWQITRLTIDLIELSVKEKIYSKSINALIGASQKKEILEESHLDKCLYKTLDHVVKHFKHKSEAKSEDKIEIKKTYAQYANTLAPIVEHMERTLSKY